MVIWHFKKATTNDLLVHNHQQNKNKTNKQTKKYSQ